MQYKTAKIHKRHTHEKLCIGLICLLDHLQLTPNIGKSRDATIDIFVGVGCGYLDSDSCFAFRDDGIAEADDVDSFLEHQIGELGGQPEKKKRLIEVQVYKKHHRLT